MAEKVLWIDDLDACEVEIYNYYCHGQNALFESEYDDLPEVVKKIIDDQNGLPCDLSGVPGPWCFRCFWGEYVIEG